MRHEVAEPVGWVPQRIKPQLSQSPDFVHRPLIIHRNQPTSIGITQVRPPTVAQVCSWYPLSVMPRKRKEDHSSLKEVEIVFVRVVDARRRIAQALDLVLRAAEREPEVADSDDEQIGADQRGDEGALQAADLTENSS